MKDDSTVSIYVVPPQRWGTAVVTSIEHIISMYRRVMQQFDLDWHNFSPKVGFGQSRFAYA